MFAANVCGLGIGYDVDDEVECPVQKCHLVEGGEHGKIHPVCGATTLWFYDWTVQSFQIWFIERTEGRTCL